VHRNLNISRSHIGHNAHKVIQFEIP